MWFRVDDTLAFHAKTLMAGNAAMGLWVRAGAHCGQHLTDGFVTREVALTIGKPAEIKRLVAARLWEPAERGGQPGYQFHEWEGRQPSRDEVEEKREADAKRKAEWRARKAADRASRDTTRDTGQEAESAECPTVTTTSVTPSVRAESAKSPLFPDPTRPDPMSPNGDIKSSEPDGSAPANAGKIVKDWIDRQRRRPAERVIGPVAKQVRELLDQHFTRAEIDAGLAAMDAKGLHPSTLSSLVSAAANSGNVTPIRGAESLTREQIDDILGPDSETLIPPPDLDPEADFPRYDAWLTHARADRRAERQRQALAELDRRVTS